MSIDFAAIFPDEVVATPIVRDVDLPGGAGTFALITLDNGLDHTKPTTLGPQTVTRLGEALDALKTRAQAGEIAQFADGVIVGSALVRALSADGIDGVAALTADLAAGVGA